MNTSDGKFILLMVSFCQPFSLSYILKEKDCLAWHCDTKKALFPRLIFRYGEIRRGSHLRVQGLFLLQLWGLLVLKSF